MYCKHCGRTIDDEAKYCQHCGGEQYTEKAAEVEETVVNQVSDTEADSEFELQKEKLAKEIFRLGLMSGIFANTIILGFLGIIFSVRTRKAVLEYIEKFGALSGRALAGNIIRIPALVEGILYTVLVGIYLTIFGIWIIVAIVALMASVGFFL